MAIRKERVAVGDPNKPKLTAPMADGCGGMGGGSSTGHFKVVHC